MRRIGTDMIALGAILGSTTVAFAATRALTDDGTSREMGAEVEAGSFVIVADDFQVSAKAGRIRERPGASVRIKVFRERAEEARQRARQVHERATQARERTEQVRERAAQARKRAEQARERAERLHHQQHEVTAAEVFEKMSRVFEHRRGELEEWTGEGVGVKARDLEALLEALRSSLERMNPGDGNE